MATATTESTELTSLAQALDARRIDDAPHWWHERQAKARETFEATRWPVERDEKWRYSLVEKLDFDSYDYTRPEASGVIPQPLMGEHESAGRIIFDNGHLVSVELDQKLKDKGVYFAPVRKALKERPELLERYFMTDLVTPDYSKFAAFHGALVDGGGVLVVPKGVEVEKPLEVHNVFSGRNVTLFPHFLIVAEPNSRLSFVNSYASKDQEDSGLVVGAMELFVQQGAQVNFITVNEWSNQVAHFEVQRHMAEKDAQVKNLVLTLGSGFARNNVEAILAGPGANSEMLGLWVGGERQKFDHRTLQEHVAPNCFSNVLYKGALIDRARSVYAGLIHVYPDAQQTDAYQTNRNMVLSNKARADTIPMLEISANDVRCSHGATIGQIEYEHLFYLMSRGVPKLEAEKLIVFGFFEEVLNKLPVPTVSEQLRDRIGQNIIGIDYEQLSVARRLVGGKK